MKIAERARSCGPAGPCLLRCMAKPAAQRGRRAGLGRIGRPSQSIMPSATQARYRPVQTHVKPRGWTPRYPSLRSPGRAAPRQTPPLVSTEPSEPGRRVQFRVGCGPIGSMTLQQARPRLHCRGPAARSATRGPGRSGPAAQIALAAQVRPCDFVYWQRGLRRSETHGVDPYGEYHRLTHMIEIKEANLVTVLSLGGLAVMQTRIVWTWR
jgi:hypothetical protein